MQEERFEILLSRLVEGDLDEATRAELDSMLVASPEHALKHRRFTETLDVLDRLPATELEIPELELEYGLTRPRRLLPANFLKIALPAAAAVLLGLGFWFYRTGSLDEPGRAVLTHASGHCIAEGKTLGAGEEPGGRRLQSGPDSICDLRIAYSANLLVRLLPESEFFYNVTNDSLNLTLARGEMMLHARKLPARGQVRLHSPGHLIEVLGTRVAVNRRRHENFHVEVLHGKARVRSAHYLFVHGLRHGIADEHRQRLAREIPELFREHEQFIEAGRHLRFAHHPEYRAATAALFQEFEDHVAEAEVDDSGAHHVHPHLTRRLKDTFRKYPELKRHFAAGPPRGLHGTLHPERATRLHGDFEHASKQDARHP